MIENEINLKELLNLNLTIPNYQRPYEWEKTNIYILIEDIMNDYKAHLEINLGTIILYENEYNKYEIVDGQQRIITLSLLLRLLNKKFSSKLFEEKLLCVSSTEQKIINNYYSLMHLIKKLENSDNLDKEDFCNYLNNNVKFYLLKAKSTEEAFQLFDGRNSKYKDLTPIDLLKAFHLGEIKKDYPLEKILTFWNTNIIEEKFSIDNSMSKIEYLFNCMLFNIYNWSLNKPIKTFSKNDIFLYKGYNDLDKYEYVKYYKSKEKDNFQINKPFKSGEGFFLMVKHYIELLDEIIKEDSLLKIYNENYHLKYIYYIYYGALLLFYDKFGKEDISKFNKETIVDYIYRWSLTHRINNKLVNLNTLNHYVLTSDFNFFFECNNALKIEELFKMEVNDIKKQPAESEKLGRLRSNLWKKLNYVMD